MRIVFVCTGNTCRSPMAAAYFGHLMSKAGLDGAVEVVSAGVYAADGTAASEQAVAVMAENGVDLGGHCSRALTEDEIRMADLLVAMTEGHRRQIMALCPAANGKTRLLLELAGGRPGGDVADPFGGDTQVYRECFEGMRASLEKLAAEIAAGSHKR